MIQRDELIGWWARIEPALVRFARGYGLDPSAAEGWLGLAKKVLERAYPYIEKLLPNTPPAVSPSPSPSPTP